MDFRAVGAGALWVLGFGVVLAACSYASWEASLRPDRPGLRRILGQPAFAVAWNLGLTLVCAGFALAGREWWEQIVWSVLGVLFALQGGYAGWQTRLPAVPAARADRPEPGDKA